MESDAHSQSVPATLDSAAGRHLLDAFSSLQTSDEAAAFLTDLCSPRELADLVQRFEVARRLDAGESYVRVSSETGASSTTVSRVSKCLRGEPGGYRLVLGRVSDASEG